MRKIKEIMIGDRMLKVEIADTWLKRLIGLSWRTKMDDIDGMLFIFPWRARWRMCMRGMKFALDFIFMDGENVVDVYKNVLPGSKTLRPTGKVNSILEVVSGLF